MRFWVRPSTRFPLGMQTPRDLSPEYDMDVADSFTNEQRQALLDLRADLKADRKLWRLYRRWSRTP